MDRHIKAPHTSPASTSLNHEVTLNKQTGSYRSLSLVHTCTRLNAHTERKHALNKSSLGLVCFWNLGLTIRGGLGCSLLEFQSVFMFSFRNVKVAAQGHYCVCEEKTPLGWFKGRSNEMSYITFMYQYELCLVFDVTQW